MIFSTAMEADLAIYVKDMARRFYSLSKEKCCCLIYEHAQRNKVNIPENWRVNKKSGQGFWLGFKSRHNLTIRSPEPTSLAPATAFNRHTAREFFSNLEKVIDRHKFLAQDIYNIDETGCTTVQNPERGIKQVTSVTSTERRELVTVINTANASGSGLPPMFVFSWVNYCEWFIRGTPVGSAGSATRSGWINEEVFFNYLDHFIQHSRCTIEQKVLLIMDNHEAHISLAAIDKAKANDAVALTIPPHTSHKLQPLDKSVYGSYKRAYGRAADAWMHSHPNTTFNIYHILGLVLEAQMSACVPRNIIAGFQSTDIFPYNSKIFCDDDFAPSEVLDRNPGVSQMVTSVENSEQSAETQTISVSIAVATEKDMPGTSTADDESNDHETTLSSTDLTACSSKQVTLQIMHLDIQEPPLLMCHSATFFRLKKLALVDEER